MDTVSEEITLSDGTLVHLRTFTKKDLDAVFDFYQTLPEDEKNLMRYDVRDKDAVRERLVELEDEQADRLVAVMADTGEIIGEAMLEPMRYGWMRKTGEIRIRMVRKYENPEVAHFICKEVFLLAARRGFNSLITKVIDGEKQLFEIFKKLNFQHEATLKNHAVDMEGKVYDIHFLTFSLHRMWKAIEESFRAADFTSREDL